MRSINIRCQIVIQAKEGYDSQTIMERDIQAAVPPGQDPVDFLLALVAEEAKRTGRAFEQFPQYLAIDSKEEL